MDRLPEASRPFFLREIPYTWTYRPGPEESSSVLIQSGMIDNLDELKTPKGADPIDWLGAGIDMYGFKWLLQETYPREQIMLPGQYPECPTRLFFFPVEAVDPSCYEYNAPPTTTRYEYGGTPVRPRPSRWGNWKMGDMAINFAFQTQTQGGQEIRPHEGFVVCSWEDGITIYQQTAADPSYFLGLLKCIRNGSLTSETGKALEIIPGERILYLPNSQVPGSWIKEPAVSAPFSKPAA